MNYLIFTLITGIGATIFTDLWGVVRRQLFGMDLPNYDLVGRWILYMPRGYFRHTSIAASSPIRGESLAGWTAHYLIGIIFATLLVCIGGPEWLEQPTIGLALIVGVATVLAPFLLMQPGMGAGIAASRTPRPNVARLQSLITHAVFGLGLYISGWAAHHLYPI